MLLVDFRRRATSALMHPATLGALGVLLVNDLLFKALWPGAWIPGKLSDLAWMVFAPPLLAYILSFATLGNARAQRAAFAAAYIGLPLLYAAFNTFGPIHDVILRGLGLFGGDRARSPLDPTDSIVIPLAMAAAIWVWRRPLLEAESIRARLALLAATAAAMASIATTYPANYGVREVGRTPSGALGIYVRSFGSVGTYESRDGGLTWTEASENFVPLERQEMHYGPDWRLWEVKDADRTHYRVPYGRPHIIRTDGRTEHQEVVYSFEYLRGGGSRWMQALDKRDISDRAIATEPHDLFFDDQRGNLIVAMGLQGVVVVHADGASRLVPVGPFSPTDFSFGSKVRTFFGSLLHPETAFSTIAAFLLVVTFAAFAIVGPAASTGPRHCLAYAAGVSALLAIFSGGYPYVPETPGQNPIQNLILLLSGLGLVPLLLVASGLLLTRTGRRQLLADRAEYRDAWASPARGSW